MSNNDDPNSSPHLAEIEKLVQEWTRHTEANEPQQAEAIAFELLLKAAEQAAAHPTPELELSIRAEECESAGDWAAAEAAWLEVIALNERAKNACLLVKPHLDLCSHYEVTNRLDLALAHASAAVQASQGTEISTLRAMALEGLAGIHLKTGQGWGALTAATDMLGLLDPGKVADSIRARGLILRARAHLLLENPRSAREDLDASWKLVEGYQLSAVCGPILSLAQWWEAQATFLEAGADLTGAAVAWRTAIDTRRRIDVVRSRLRVAAALGHLARVLTQTGDMPGAAAALTEAAEIRRNACLPG